MVSEGRGRLFRRKDGKYLIYLPVRLAEDSMFPFAGAKARWGATGNIPVKVSFKPGVEKLVVEKWEPPEKKIWKKRPEKTPKPPEKTPKPREGR